MPTHDAAQDAAHDTPTKHGKHSAFHAAQEARVGMVLKEKWRLDKLIGVGGMASVYAATHRNGKRVAIKMLHEDLAQITDVRTRFLREGYLANAVGHDGVVSIVDDDVSEDGAIFLVMELLEGETIERRWDRKERRLPVSEVLWIATELLDVLAAAHAKGVIHRDIKPENLFLTRDGTLKVLDFGIARLRERTPGAATTQGGMTMGTPAFMAPEQARGRWDEVDGRSDIWAVGGMMFALLAGRFVHVATTMNEQLLAAMTRPAPPTASMLPDLAPEVARVIDRALAFKVEDRWESARAMQEGIREAMTPSETRAAAAIDPEKTAAIAPLVLASLASTATPTIDHVVASAPSAAPVRSPPLLRHSPYVVGLGAGAVGIAIALATILHVPGRFRVAAAAATAATAPARALDEALPAAALVRLPHPADRLPVPVIPAASAPVGGDAGLVTSGFHAQPAPPATGVPESLPLEVPPVARRASAVAAASMAAQDAVTSPPPAADAPVASSGPAQVDAPPASSAAAVAPEAPVETEGLLDRRH